MLTGGVRIGDEVASQELEWEDKTLGRPYPWTTEHAQKVARQIHEDNPEFAKAVALAVQQQEEDALAMAEHDSIESITPGGGTPPSEDPIESQSGNPEPRRTATPLPMCETCGMKGVDLESVRAKPVQPYRWRRVCRCDDFPMAMPYNLGYGDTVRVHQGTEEAMALYFCPEGSASQVD
jgi:hypothetical protein